MNNPLAIKTLRYIWRHPNCKDQRLRSISRFVGWQIYKRLLRRHLDLDLLPGVKLRCYPDSYSAAAVLYCGLYDYDEMNFLLRYLRTEDQFLDIGANIGSYTLLAASKIRAGFIHSLEPLPKNYKRLQENLALNQFNQVKTYAMAVSDQVGKAILNLAEGDSMPFLAHAPMENSIEVLTDTLDHLLKDRVLDNLTLAKMDIEGAELLALKGATSLLRQQRPQVWILEINDRVSNFNHRQQDVVNFLQNWGYGLYRYQADTNQVSPIDLQQQQGNNVLAIAGSALEFVQARLAESQNLAPT